MASLSRETITNSIKRMTDIEILPQETIAKIRLLAASGILVWTTWYFARFVKNFREKRALRRKGKMHAQKLRQQIIDLAERLKHGNVTKEARDHITSLSIADLIDQLQNGQLKPTEVLEAYQAKALEVHEKTNCLVGLVDDAEEIAKKLDSSTEKGPLYGVPFGVKEFQMLKGHPWSMGFSKCLDIPVPEDAVFIQILKEQGAIPFVRTNIPQSGLSYACANPIFGETVNPHDPTRTPGGSSGGCGALVGGGGALVSFGSDIGGSVRSPAALCGIYSLRPTQGRFSEKGVLTMEGQTIVSAVYGPMCRDLDCLVRITKAQLTPHMYELDLSVPLLPFNTEIYEGKRRLRIGYFYQAGQLHTVPASERAVKQAKDILERRGHTLVAWSPPRQDEVLWTWLRVLNGDGGETMLKEMARNEEICRCLTSYLSYKYPAFLRKIVVAYWTYIRKDPHMARVIDGFRSTGSVSDWWRLVALVQSYRREFLSDWAANQLDAVICPPLAFPPVKVGSPGEKIEHGPYLIMYNLLNMPAGVMPVTKVKHEDIVQLTQLQNLDERLQFVKEDAIGSEGLPVAVQVAAAPFREEMVLRVMKEVDSGFPSS